VIAELISHAAPHRTSDDIGTSATPNEEIAMADVTIIRKQRSPDAMMAMLQQPAAS
jgi:hypothetical protein